MEYKNQTENRAFQEMLQAAVKRLQNRSGEEIAAKSGAVFHSSRNMLVSYRITCNNGNQRTLRNP